MDGKFMCDALHRPAETKATMSLTSTVCSVVQSFRGMHLNNREPHNDHYNMIDSLIEKTHCLYPLIKYSLTYRAFKNVIKMSNVKTTACT